jgi:hypothetical protein
MTSMTEDIAMAPAYGGMFRPPPQRRVGIVILVVFAALALVIGAIASGVWMWKRHQRLAENGQPCATICAYGNKCIHETSGDAYCAIECDGDRDCPSAYVCEPTLSGRHHVCLKSGVERAAGGRRRSR